jgi:hypothetical protein
MKTVRHPNLVSLFGAWHRDNWLILAMELCDRSLQDRLTEALDQGLPGIPLHELLGYMSDAANGLDALNASQVQHRDIKPANLLLLASGVKVADFGLAKALEQTVASNSGAGTLAYTPPESFKGKLAKQSDQYSLAVTYYYLRTGELLFKGNQAKVMYGHLEEQPDLSKLWPAEAAVIGRALAKEPRKRWESCRAFVSELDRNINELVNALVRAQEDAFEEEHRRIMIVLGHAWGLVGRLCPELASQIREVRFIELPKEARAVLAIRPSTGTLGVAVGCRGIAPDYLYHELVHLQQFVEGRLPPPDQRTNEQFIEIEREAYARQGQIIQARIIERLEEMLEAKAGTPKPARVKITRGHGQPCKGVYPPAGVAPLEYDWHEWEMLTSVRPEDEERQPLPD